MQTYDPNSTKQHWQVKDIIFLALLAAFFGLIYQGASYLYYALAATFLKPYANDLMLGIWLMAGPLAAILLKRRGAAFLGEFLAATAEMLLFSSWGAANLITGALQGSASELGWEGRLYFLGSCPLYLEYPGEILKREGSPGKSGGKCYHPYLQPLR